MKAFLAMLVALPLIGGTPSALAQGSGPEARARETEQQMTDEERFGLIRSLMVVVFGQGGGGRDPRVPEGVVPAKNSIRRIVGARARIV